MEVMTLRDLFFHGCEIQEVSNSQVSVCLLTFVGFGGACLLALAT